MGLLTIIYSQRFETTVITKALIFCQAGFNLASAQCILLIAADHH